MGGNPQRKVNEKYVFQQQQKASEITKLPAGLHKMVSYENEFPYVAG